MGGLVGSTSPVIWECGVLAIGPPGKFTKGSFIFIYLFIYFLKALLNFFAGTFHKNLRLNI